MRLPSRAKATVTSAAKTHISGKWRITEMDLWDQEAIDLRKDGSLTGHIYFHQGDASGFKAIPFEDDAQPTAKANPTAKRGLR